MSNRRLFAWLLAIVSAWCSMAGAAAAQSILDRLDAQIRQRTGQGGDAAQPGQASPSNDLPRIPPPPPDSPANGRVVAEPAYLGAVVDDQKDRGRGVRVVEVRPGSPAERAGLRKQDLITRAANRRIRQMSDMSSILNTFGPGDKLPLDIIRGLRPERIEVTLGRRPNQLDQQAGAAELVPLPQPERVSPPPPPLPGGAPETSPAGPALIGPSKDGDRIAQLQRRVEQLERRVEELEKTLAETRKK